MMISRYEEPPPGLKRVRGPGPSNWWASGEEKEIIAEQESRQAQRIREQSKKDFMEKQGEPVNNQVVEQPKKRRGLWARFRAMRRRKK